MYQTKQMLIDAHADIVRKKNALITEGWDKIDELRKENEAALWKLNNITRLLDAELADAKALKEENSYLQTHNDALMSTNENIGNMHTAEVDANCVLKDQNDHFRATLTAIGISATSTSKLEGE